MAGSVYSVYKSQLTDNHTAILAAWGDAEAEMLSLSAPPLAYRELYWDGTNVVRLIDLVIVSTLDPVEQLRLFPQLDQLFVLVVNKILYV